MGEPGQFLLTGSATPNAASQPMHSGVGRVSRLRMDTMTLLELGISSGLVSLGTLFAEKPVGVALGSIEGISAIADLVCRGGWPQAVGRSTEDAMCISSAYVDGVCESDVSKVDGVKRDPEKVRALLSSLAVALLGANPESLVSDPKTLGLLFESFVLHDLKVYAAVNDSSVSHYHDADDLEVDAVIHRRDGTWIAVEVKLGSSQIPEASANLLRLERKLVERGKKPPAAKLIVIGFGMPAHTMPEGVIVAPVDTLAP